MPYTTEEGGRLNNFASEPKVYDAVPPNKTEQRNYIIMGIAAFLFISGVLAVAVLASKVG